MFRPVVQRSLLVRQPFSRIPIRRQLCEKVALPRKRYTGLKFMGALFLVAAILLGNEIASSGCEVHAPVVASPPQNLEKQILNDMHQFGEDKDFVFLSIGGIAPAKISSEGFMAQLNAGEWDSILVHSQFRVKGSEDLAASYNLYVRNANGSVRVVAEQPEIYAHLRDRMANPKGTSDMIVYHKEIPLHNVFGLENMSYLSKMFHVQRDEPFPVHYLVLREPSSKPKDLQLIRDALGNVPGALVTERKVLYWDQVESALLTLARSRDPHPIAYWPLPNVEKARLLAILERVDPKGRITILIPTHTVKGSTESLAIFRGQSVEVCEFYQDQGEETKYAALAEMLKIIHTFPSSSSADYVLLHKGLRKHK